MEPMTKQQVFDRVAAHLLRQGERSLLTMLAPGPDLDDEDGTCAYRGEGGLQCAVGCLIPDDLYDPEMEDKTVRTLLEHPRFGKRLEFMEPHRALLRELQKVHDRSSPHRWRKSLAGVARMFDLQFDPEALLGEGS